MSPSFRSLLLVAVLTTVPGPGSAREPAEETPSSEEAAAALFDWNDLFTSSVMRDSVAPGHVSRRAAILSLAAYDAYHDRTSLEDSCTMPRETGLASLPENGTERELAALAALRHGSLVLFPSHAPAIDEWWREASQAAGSRDLDPETAARAEARGKQWAYAYLEGRADDGATSQTTYIPSDEPGHWRRTPPRYRPPELSHWGRLRPFCLERADQFRAPPPPALDSAEYLEAVEEVRLLGGRESTHRSADDTESGRFWACFSYTPTPAGHWNTLLNVLLRQREAGFAETLNAYRLMNVALADAFIACWDTKYHYCYWRPEDAIRAAGHQEWLPLLESPPHPEYPSGHSSAAGAGCEILRQLFGDRIPPTDLESVSLPGALRSFDSITVCRDEMGRSRIYGGIHFSFSNREGKRLGEQVAREVLRKLGEAAEPDRH